MKPYLYLLLSLFLSSNAVAQCVIDHWSLDKRIDNSSLVIEGRVIAQEGQWDAQHHNIYTLNTIEVYKCFKGQLQTDYIQLATAGGIVGTDKHSAEPSLSLQEGQVGTFMLLNAPVAFDGQAKVYLATAVTESFILYDLRQGLAFDTHKTFYSINTDLYQTLQASTGETYTEHIPFDAESGTKKIKALAPPSITSVDVDSISSGTGVVLTISGSNFGLVRGNGKVGFKDADYGDGRYYYTPIGVSYESWSNSQIKVVVPTKAGTGPIQVVSNTGESGTSSFDLNINFAHSNVLYATTTSDTNFYETQHVSYNSDGGYSWQMTHNFAGKLDANKAFYRSLEAWRCGTLMNWDVGQDTSLDQTANDQVNIVRFDDLVGSRLGTCWSRFSGCYSSTNSTWYWYVRELDIEFDSTYNWHYGENQTPSGKYDFQSVATHELGHGHQLNHVRDQTKIMHYSIGPGSKKDDLSSFDIEGGEYVKDKSVASGVCGRSAMTALTGSNCQITLPIVAFTINDTVVCPNETVTFTNDTEGNSLIFEWTFGDGASTATATTEGPHQITYSSSGTKTIKLVIENSFGKDSLERTIEVLQPKPDQPESFVSSDTGCLGESDYAVETVDNATGYAWAVSSGGSFVGGSTGQQVTVDWSTPGTKTITVVALGECGNSPQRRDTIEVLGDAVADFSEQIDGLTVNFNSESLNAESYNWSFGDAQSSTEQDPSHDYPDKGSYTVQLNVSNQCNEDSTDKDLDLNFKASIDQYELATMLYPNPISSGALLHLPVSSPSTVSIVNLEGKVVEEIQLNSGMLRMPKLVDGLYVLRLTQDGTIRSFKLWVENNR